MEELIITNKKLDYKIISHKQLEDKSHAILVKNNNKLLGPVSVSGIKDGKLVGTVWYNGFKGKRVFEFPPSDVDEFRIDFEEYMPEVKRKNNNIRTSSVKKEKEQIAV